MRTPPRRLLSAAISIVLGVAFLATALLAGASLSATLTAAARSSVGNASVVVSTPRAGDLLAVETPEKLRGLPGVTAVRTAITTLVEHDQGGRQTLTAAQSVPPLSATTRLVSGRLPAARGEVAMNDVGATSRGLAVGARVTLLDDSHQAVAATLVGIVVAGAEVNETTGMPVVFATDADLMAWRGRPGYDTAYVTASGDPEALAERVRAEVPTATVRTGEAETAYRIKEYTRGTGEVTTLFAAFGVVALFVTGLVIANTFAILVAQRTRQLALLRCVGATRGQVFRSVLAEALVVGAVGSAAGVALGVGATAGLLAAGRSIGLPVTELAVTPLAVGAPLAAGIVLTVVAALVPARRATAIAPLAALRPVPVDAGRRVGAVRVGIGAVSFLGGSALLAAGTLSRQMVFGVAGGVLSFAGVLIVAPLIVPAAAAALGALARGTTGRLAVANSRRNPARAAATAGALLVGVTLVTMMSVGAETGRATIDREFSRQFVADAQVSFPGAMPEAARARIGASEGVAGWVEAMSLGVERPGKAALEVVALAPGADAVLRDTAGLTGLRDGVLNVGAQLATEGEPVTLVFGDRRLTLTAHVTGGVGTSGTPVLTLADARRLAPEVPTYAVVRFADRTDAASVTEKLGASLAQVAPGVRVSGVAEQRQEMQRIIDTVLLVAVALLGVAVVIAVVGVGNTLALSVLERTQETGLLRALGLTRGQVRSMLGIEALTLSGVAVILGLILGTVYGLTGMATVLSARTPLVVALPWERLALVAGVGLASGWLASVLPAARASRVPPAAALAFE